MTEREHDRLDEILAALPPPRPRSDLARARLDAGLTQAQLALKVGCGVSTVSRAEAGDLSDAMRVRFARALGVSPESIRRPPYVKATP